LCNDDDRLDYVRVGYTQREEERRAGGGGKEGGKENGRLLA